MQLIPMDTPTRGSRARAATAIARLEARAPAARERSRIVREERDAHDADTRPERIDGLSRTT
jgi:hypothetical protein